METKKALAATEAQTIPSRVQQIAELKVGESFAIVERLDGDSATKEAIQEARYRLRNLIAAAVKRAKDRTGAVYTVETGEITTRSLDLLVVVTVTRME